LKAAKPRAIRLQGTVIFRMLSKSSRVNYSSLPCFMPESRGALGLELNGGPTRRAQHSRNTRPPSSATWRTRFGIPEGLCFREQREAQRTLLRKQRTFAKATPKPEIGRHRGCFRYP
jgi:hypothetical protein